MAIASTAEFVELLQPLLDRAQRDELAVLDGAYADPKALAKELMRREWLTPFQVNQIFQGRGQELTFGPYILLERLGQGGMGQVFKARHQVMNRVVALKVIREERLGSSEAVTRFRREIQATAQLAHTHIVLAHDAGQVGKQHFLVMEFIAGVDLARLVQKAGPLPVAQACDYVRQAALGLQHAHERGLVHRDIKPSNLLVSTDGVVKVLDLGLARPLPAQVQGHPDLTRTGAVVGTPDFLAPEQARDAHVVDIRADIYSLGCTLYFLLAGRPPFPESSLTQKLLWHQNDEPTGLASLRTDIPAEVIAIVQRMMAKDPAARLQTPAAVAAALTPYCQGPRLPVLPTAPVPTPPSHERGWTLAVSSPDQATPLSAPGAPSGNYEPGWTLTVPESRAEPPPLSAATVAFDEPRQPTRVDEASPISAPASRSGPSPSWRRNWIMVASVAGGSVLLVAVLLIFWPRLEKENKAAPPTPLAAGKKADDVDKSKENKPATNNDKDTPKKIIVPEPEPDPEPVLPKSEPPLKDPTDDPAKPWGEGPVRVNFTSKLGVTAKLAGDVSTDYSSLGPEFNYGYIFREIFGPKRGRGLGLGKSQTNYLTVIVDQGLVLLIPLDQVKSATVKDKRHVIALRGGKEIAGQLLNAIKDSDSGKVYRLQDAKTAVFHQTPATTPAKPPAARFVCTVGALDKRSFGLVDYYLPGHTGRFDNNISIHLAGDDIQANLADFHSFVITPEEKAIKIKLLTPQGEESVGQYRSFTVFVGEATNGWLLLQFGRGGFTSLEVRKAAARNTP